MSYSEANVSAATVAMDKYRGEALAQVGAALVVVGLSAERAAREEQIGDDMISYPVLMVSSLSRLAVMDSSTELVPLIHAPPSLRRSSGRGPQSKTSVTTAASSPSGVRM